MSLNFIPSSFPYLHDSSLQRSSTACSFLHRFRQPQLVPLVGYPQTAFPFRLCASATTTPAGSTPARAKLVTATTQDLVEYLATHVGDERGLFGLKDSVTTQIADLAAALEAVTPHPQPTQVINSVIAGKWRLLYSTITILGHRRIQLAIKGGGKKGFVSVGNMYQEVLPIDQGKNGGVAINTVEFDAMAGMAKGDFTIVSDYVITSDQRVDVTMVSKRLVPEKFEAVLGSKIDILTDIFNPTGYLDITYVDENIRIGRDDKDNLFILERVNSTESRDE